MEDLEKLQLWLRTFPLWGGAQIHIDCLPVKPENAAVYPLGLELLEEKKDLLGNTSARFRQRFELRRVVCPGEDPAVWMLRFGQWVAEQSALGLTPRLGDGSEQVFRAENGRLKEVTAAGTAVYGVTITAEFIKIMEEK